MQSRNDAEIVAAYEKAITQEPNDDDLIFVNITGHIPSGKEHRGPGSFSWIRSDVDGSACRLVIMSFNFRI